MPFRKSFAAGISQSVVGLQLPPFGKQQTAQTSRGGPDCKSGIPRNWPAPRDRVTATARRNSSLPRFLLLSSVESSPRMEAEEPPPEANGGKRRDRKRMQSLTSLR